MVQVHLDNASSLRFMAKRVPSSFLVSQGTTRQPIRQLTSDEAVLAHASVAAQAPVGKSEAKSPEATDGCEYPDERKLALLSSAVAKAASADYVPLSGAERAALGMRPRGAGRGGKGGKGRDIAKLFSTTVPANFSRKNIRDNRVFKSSQMVSWGTYTSQVSAISTFQVEPTISSLDQVSAYLAMYDQYRVTALEVWVIPRITSVTSNTANTGQVVSVIDYDDTTSLASFNAALDYENALVGSGVDGHYRKWVPHVNVLTGASGVYNVAAPWLDAASTSVIHYGMKLVWTATDSAYVSDIFVRYWMEWRNIR